MWWASVKKKLVTHWEHDDELIEKKMKKKNIIPQVNGIIAGISFIMCNSERSL